MKSHTKLGFVFLFTLCFQMCFGFYYPEDTNHDVRVVSGLIEDVDSTAHENYTLVYARLKGKTEVIVVRKVLTGAVRYFTSKKGEKVKIPIKLLDEFELDDGTVLRGHSVEGSIFINDSLPYGRSSSSKSHLYYYAFDQDITGTYKVRYRGGANVRVTLKSDMSFNYEYLAGMHKVSSMGYFYATGKGVILNDYSRDDNSQFSISRSEFYENDSIWISVKDKGNLESLPYAVLKPNKISIDTIFETSILGDIQIDKDDFDEEGYLVEVFGFHDANISYNYHVYDSIEVVLGSTNIYNRKFYEQFWLLKEGVLFDAVEKVMYIKN